MKPNLVYTIAFDKPGFVWHGKMAKMLASSLVRTYFGGDVIIIHNNPHPIFSVPRQGVEEIIIDLPEIELLSCQDPESVGRPYRPQILSTYKSGKSTPAWGRAHSDALARVSMSWKYRARHHINEANYEWIVFIDADSLVLRNMDHLFSGASWEGEQLSPPAAGLFEQVNADILYQPELGRSGAESVFSAYTALRTSGAAHGINSGTWAVRAKHYQKVMEVWEEIESSPPLRHTQWTEQGAWNRLIRECSAGVTCGDDPVVADDPSSTKAKLQGIRARPFERGEIQFPLHLDQDWRIYKEAALIHAVGANPQEKLEFLFGMFMQRFYGDPSAVLLNILET